MTRPQELAVTPKLCESCRHRQGYAQLTLTPGSDLAMADDGAAEPFVVCPACIIDEDLVRPVETRLVTT